MIENEITQKIEKLDALYKWLIIPVTFLIIISFDFINYLVEHNILGMSEEKDVFLGPALVSYTTFFLIVSIILYLFAFPIHNKWGYTLRVLALFFIILTFVLVTIPFMYATPQTLIGIINPPWAIIVLAGLSYVILCGITKKLWPFW